MKLKFYCDECLRAYDRLKKIKGKFVCPSCENILFVSKAKLDKYIMTESSNVIEPFKKKRGFNTEK